MRKPNLKSVFQRQMDLKCDMVHIGQLDYRWEMSYNTRTHTSLKEMMNWLQFGQHFKMLENFPMIRIAFQFFICVHPISVVSTVLSVEIYM